MKNNDGGRDRTGPVLYDIDGEGDQGKERQNIKCRVLKYLKSDFLGGLPPHATVVVYMALFYYNLYYNLYSKTNILFFSSCICIYMYIYII